MSTRTSDGQPGSKITDLRSITLLSDGRGWTAYSGEPAITIVSLLSLIGASRRCRAEPRTRWAWTLLAVGGFVYFLGDIAQSVYETVGRLPFPSIADGLYLLFYPLAFCGLLLAGSGRGERGQRVRFGLDLAVVALSAAAVMVYVILGPELIESGPNVFKTAVAVAYPVGDMLLLVAVGSLVLRGSPPSGALAFGLLALGLLFFVSADVFYHYVQLHSSYRGGDAVDVLDYMLAVALFGVAGAAQWSAQRPRVHLKAQAGCRPAPWRSDSRSCSIRIATRRSSRAPVC